MISLVSLSLLWVVLGKVPDSFLQLGHSLSYTYEAGKFSIRSSQSLYTFYQVGRNCGRGRLKNFSLRGEGRWAHITVDNIDTFHLVELSSVPSLPNFLA